jgi:hypothetical protein
MTANPTVIGHEELARQIQSLVAANLGRVMEQSQRASAHLDGLGQVTRELIVKVRVPAPGQAIERASLTVTASAAGVLGEEKGQTVCEVRVTAPKMKPRPRGGVPGKPVRPSSQGEVGRSGE